jgi:hypothetical protein
MAAISGTALAIGAGLAGAGSAISLGSGLAAASAQEKAGRAQLAAAEAGLGFAREQIEAQRAERQRLEQLAEPSQAELDNIELILQTTEKGLQQAQSLLDQEAKILDETDPVIKEAAANLTNLLRGEQSRFLKPLREQRRRQKAELETKLAAQLGPGFRTSAAGIQAINQFDQQSDEILTNAQFQATNQVSGVLAQTAGLRRGFGVQAAQIFGAGAAAQAQALAGRQAIEQRALTAASIQPVDFGAIVRAQQGVTAAAEAPFVGDITRARAFGEVGRTFGQLGGAVLGGGIGGGGNILGATSGAASGAQAGATAGAVTNPFVNPFAPQRRTGGG